MKFLNKIFALCLFLVGMFTSSLEALPAQVIVIRHGEKSSTGMLTQMGQERAGALPPYFTQTQELLLFGEPFAFFAARPVPVSARFKDDNTLRCIQTLIPTANLLSLPVHSPYGPGQEAQLVDLILNDSRYDGKNIVICWHHTSIANLITAFGYNPPFKGPYPNNVYYWVFVMPFPIASPDFSVPPGTFNPPFASWLSEYLLVGDPPLPLLP